MSKSRQELVNAAHAAAAAVFVSAKNSITPAMHHRARLAAYAAIERADYSAGTKDHPHAAYSYGIVAVADEGVQMAMGEWHRIRNNGGASGIWRRLKI